MEKTRAASYIRTSTDREAQEGSFEIQKKYFEDLITSDPELEYVGCYGDFGKSGRFADTRPEFQRILDLRAPRGECSRYPYEDAPIVCPICGKKLTTRLMHVQTEKKALACFADDGCHGFAVKTWMLDEVLRAAFEELEEIPGSGDAAKRMRAMKAAGTPESIEYYFLADAVKKISFIPHPGTRTQKHKKGPATEEKTCDWDVVIDWQCGLTSTLPLPHDDRYTEEPMHVAELYERYLERIKTGDYIPTRPKNLRERQMKAEQRIVTRINPVPSAT